MPKALDAALEYVDQGWSVIPINPKTKRPLVEWAEYQKRTPTEDEILEWFEQWIDADIAVVTGEVSGIVVVDCDSEDASRIAFDCGMRSPIQVQTKRGHHLYFLHPCDGKRRGPRAGSNSRGVDWPKYAGLDFRGDGSYAVLPPSTGYEWRYPSGMDWEDAPIWQDWTPSVEIPETPAPSEFTFTSLDLRRVVAFSAEDFMSEWDRTKKYVRDKFPETLKIPTGQSNGRNQRVMHYVSECVMDGYWGGELRVRGIAFMKEFFLEPLPDPEFEATCRSIEEAERRNHPERFDSDGQYIPRPGANPLGTLVSFEAESEADPEGPKLIQMSDAEDLLEAAQSKKFFIEPWLTPGTIVQVYGYSGHGKSLFLQHALAAVAAGGRSFGPFELGEIGKTLYFDWENGMRTLGNRLNELRTAHGNTDDRLKIWTPFISDENINLKTPEGMRRLQEWIVAEGPDIVVIDTIRSAFPGLEENSASEWSRVNEMATRLRNAGIACILMHHANKPGESGSGREAGSTAQLTTLETQIKVTQVFEDEDLAKLNGGVFDESYTTPVWPMLKKKCPSGYRLYMVNEISYGKVREFTDTHDRVQWVGYAANDETDERCVVSSSSTKQRAKEMAIRGYSIEAIATMLQRPQRAVMDWLEIRE